jgi:hypothetical protein
MPTDRFTSRPMMRPAKAPAASVGTAVAAITGRQSGRASNKRRLRIRSSAAKASNAPITASGIRAKRSITVGPTVAPIRQSVARISGAPNL